MKVNIKKVEKLMHSYKRTGNEFTLQQILKEIRGVIIVQSNQKFKSCNSTLNSEDDFKTMATTFAWKAIMEYKYICPICGEKLDSVKEFNSHTKEMHNCGQVINGKKVRRVKSKSPIFYYVTKLIHNYLNNVVRDEETDKRKANLNNNKVSSIVSDADSEYEVSIFESMRSSDDTENLIITKDMVSKMMDKINEEGKKAHAFVLNGLIRGYSQIDLANYLFNKKVYKSVSSAKVSVSKIARELKCTYLAVSA